MIQLHHYMISQGLALTFVTSGFMAIKMVVLTSQTALSPSLKHFSPRTATKSMLFHLHQIFNLQVLHLTLGKQPEK